MITVLRKIRHTDVEAVSTVIAEFDRTLVREAVEQITAELDNTSDFGSRYIAAIDGEVVGTMGYNNGPIPSPYVAWADWLCVACKYRRNRIATDLYRAVERDIVGAGRKIICLDLGTLSDQQPAYAFHKNNGFELAGTIQGYWGPGKDFNVMRKYIANALQLDAC